VGPSPASLPRSVTPSRVTSNSDTPSYLAAPDQWLPSEMTMDVTDSTFETAVIERSRTLPVVVDFWAEWCGPCRQLGPVIERSVAARAGQVELAKLDVDANPNVARRFQIQSIPAVKAFRDGEVAAEFV